MGKLPVKLKTVINYLKKNKNSKLNINKDIDNAARYEVKIMIFNKKRVFLERKSTESVGKPKDL